MIKTIGTVITVEGDENDQRKWTQRKTRADFPSGVFLDGQILDDVGPLEGNKIRLMYQKGKENVCCKVVNNTLWAIGVSIVAVAVWYGYTCRGGDQFLKGLQGASPPAAAETQTNVDGALTKYLSVLFLVTTILAVVSFLPLSFLPIKGRGYVLAIWTLLIPLVFFFYYVLSPHLETPEFEQFKYNQELSSKAWLAFITVLAFRYFGDLSLIGKVAGFLGPESD